MTIPPMMLRILLCVSLSAYSLTVLACPDCYVEKCVFQNICVCLPSPQCDPKECEAACPRQSDPLFPTGIADQACVRRCSQITAAPPSPAVRPAGDNRAFILLEPMRYEIGTSGVSIVVPTGFVTDYASIPKSLWSLYSPHDQYSRAAIVHDYLYWSQLCTRIQADNIFMIAMRESEVSERDRSIIYTAVHELGASSWEENSRQRSAGYPRIVPVDRADFPPNWSWEMYRKKLIAQGIKDPTFPAGDYCALGNNYQIPVSVVQAEKNSSKDHLKVTAPKLVARPLQSD